MKPLPRFDRKFFEGNEEITVIGSGSLGGKARGLAEVRDVLDGLDTAAFPGLTVSIPIFAVIATDLYDEFLKENNLRELIESGGADGGAAAPGLSDRAIAMAFQRASLPAGLVGDLQALIAKVHTPLAVRSSSLLEDARDHPFAGVYATKMIPNNQLDPDARFRRLLEAVKFVYASTFFREARDYARAIGRTGDDEKMAVIIQEVVGRRHADRFYPDISGVGRSYNFYPTGHASPEDGVVTLALGLGRTIVDEGRGWSYSPAFPRSIPPYKSIRDLLKMTQTEFWAVNMGKPPDYDPVNEAEYLVLSGLEEAEEDEVLGSLASVYDAESDRLIANLSRPGARVLNFAPLLVNERLPLNAAIHALLASCRSLAGADVEIELAATLEQEGGLRGRIGFLQMRPLAVSNESVILSLDDLKSPEALVATESALGNGVNEEIRDIVYLRPDAFDSSQTLTIASDLEGINRGLISESRSYLLIGFGRWGTTDPWLGVPVDWAQISGARAIVESSLPGLEPEPSQASHFFHNVTSFRVLYFTVPHSGPYRIDWDWLGSLPAKAETPFLRHLRLDSPLRIAVDGRSRRGVVLRSAERNRAS